MYLPPSASVSKRWTLVVHLDLSCTSELVYAFEDGTLCRVPLTTAQTTLMLLLAACRKVDDDDGNGKGGSRRREVLGKLVRYMPGTGNPVEASSILDYRGKIIARVKRALTALSRQHHRTLAAPDPIVHPRYAHGYSVPAAGLDVTGVSMEELAQRVRDAARPHGFEPGK